MNTATSNFRAALEAAGLMPGQIIDGQFTRCATMDKPHSKNGCFVFHADHPASGWFSDWQTGESQTWTAKNGKPLTAIEKEILAQRVKADKAARDAEQAARWEDARNKAASIWEASQAATDAHPYLLRKGVSALGGIRQSRGALVVPVRDGNGAISSLQFIQPDGSRKFLLGGKTRGCCFAIPAKDESTDGPLVILEGFSTGASVHEATGHAVLCALSAGNLMDVAKLARAKHPARGIIIAADDDRATPGNPGITKAILAAKAVNGWIAIPAFTDPSGKSDFNDLAQAEGMDAVRSCLEKCQSHMNEKHNLLTLAPWPDPIPLPPARPLAPALNPDVCPRALLPWWQDVADRAQMPLETVAVASIVVLSSIVGRSVAIRPKLADSWTVVPNLWGMVVGRPSTLKSEAINVASAPLARLVAKAREEFYAANLKAMSRETVQKIKKDEVEKQIKTAIKKDADKDEIDELTAKHADLLKDEANERVVERRFYTSDATVEKLAELLRDNPNGMLLKRDELSGWLRGLCRHGREGDREFFLESWAGDGSFQSDRIGRGSTTVKALCLSVLGTIQPAKLESYIRGAVNGTVEDDGLLQRFQMLVWPEQGADWQNIDRPLDRDSREVNFTIHEELAKLVPASIGALTSEYSDLPYLKFSQDAQLWFDGWREKLEKRLRSPEFENCPAYESHLGKYRSLMPSLALIFHLVDCVSNGTSGPVSAHATSQAIEWCDFLEAHARKVYAEEINIGDVAAFALARKIQEGAILDGDTMRSVYRAQWSSLTTSDAALQAVQALERLNWLRLVAEGEGPRKALVLRLNPALAAFLKNGSGLK